MKEQAQQQLHDMGQQNGDIKEQLDTYEKRLQTAEDKLTKMKLKNKSLMKLCKRLMQV